MCSSNCCRLAATHKGDCCYSATWLNLLAQRRVCARRLLRPASPPPLISTAFFPYLPLEPHPMLAGTIGSEPLHLPTHSAMLARAGSSLAGPLAIPPRAPSEALPPSFVPTHLRSRAPTKVPQGSRAAAGAAYGWPVSIRGWRRGQWQSQRAGRGTAGTSASPSPATVPGRLRPGSPHSGEAVPRP